MEREALTISLILCCGVLSAAGTGDFDGDGRLSIADVLRFEDSLRDPNGVPLAPGSLDGFGTHVCTLAGRNFRNDHVSGAVLVESLRRKVPDPMPHWESVWSETVFDAPLAADPRCAVRVESAFAPGGVDDRVRIRIALETTVALRAFVLLLESDGGLLRVPASTSDPDMTSGYRWYGRNGHEHDDGDFRVHADPAAFLATRGRFVIGRSLFAPADAPRPPDIAPGAWSIEVEARLPRGAAQGIYGLRALAGSEFVLADGSLAGATIEGDATLRIERSIEVGWDGGVPPLEFDVASRRVLGRVEFRVVDREGVPADPVFQGERGDAFPARVQMRSTVPLNSFEVDLRWRHGALDCDGDPTLLFADPLAGAPFSPVQRNSGEARHCRAGDVGLSEGTSLYVFQIGSGIWSSFPTAIHGDRPLEYFEASGEWVDLWELKLRIPDDAPAGDVALRFVRPEDHRSPLALYAPYSPIPLCDVDQHRSELSGNWRYEIVHQDARVVVLGDGQPPVPSADGGLRVALGDVSGAPGETIEVPVLVASVRPLGLLRIAVEIDPEFAVVDAVEARYWSALADEFRRTAVARGDSVIVQECPDPDQPPDATCRFGEPFAVLFHETAGNVTLIDAVFGTSDDRIADDEPREFARLRVRIRDDARAGSTPISQGVVRWTPGVFEEETTSGAIFAGEIETFFRAGEQRGATLTVVADGAFRRGDSNVDGRVDLSDAVRSLDFLFGSSERPGCIDAADANDDGLLDISDAVYTLGFLFLGGDELPPPSSRCGEDPTADSLDCEAICG